MAATTQEPAAGAAKARGAFFTPPALVDYLTEWAVRSPADTILEPSCGEAVFVISAVERLRALGAGDIPRQQIHAIDVHDESLEVTARELAERGVEVTLRSGDFFDSAITPLFDPIAGKKFDAVIGNPPYVRYQSFRGVARAKAREAALLQGVELSGLASSWAAFVVHAAGHLKPAGRLALVLPAELLTVGYAAPVRRFLLERFATVRLVAFEERVFPGVLEEVVLLLAEGAGPADGCQLRQTASLATLASAREQRIWTPQSSDDKWTGALLARSAAETYYALTEDPAFTLLVDWGETDLGMVTGNNKYFALSADKARVLGLPESELLAISPPGSHHLRGLTFTSSLWHQLRGEGQPVYLFDPDAGEPSEAARSYVTVGEAMGVHSAYKCRVRSPWWKVPKLPVPDLFLTYMNHDAPRLVANRARAGCLNSVHGVLLPPGRKRLGMDLLPIAALNTLTLLGAELVGRSYGGGLLKLEPREADNLPVPSPATLQAAQKPLRALRPLLTRHLRDGRLEAAVDLVDRALLREHLGIGTGDVGRLRTALDLLFHRRASRARSQRAG